ncbi:WD40 repeat domain-containing protein [Streptomyces flavidovirens]|uniref:WD40 repeat domain-containing protein n=1 Tax=Streptomyces flavidovirens TaxID=67298 RepID=UPI00342937CE
MSPDEQERSPQSGEEEAHARIAAALARLAGPDAVAAPHPYLRRYLAHHAVLGQTLDDDHLPPSLLPWITGDRVRGLLGVPSTQRGQQRWLTAWAAIEPYVQRADLPSRRSSLHLAYTTLYFPGVPYAQLPQQAAVFAGSQLRVLWSQWAPPSNVLATLNDTSLSVATTEGLDGALLLAVGNEAGGIELIDAFTGTAVGERISAHDGAVRSLLFVPHPAGGGELVSGSTDGTVRIWDTNQGTLINHLTRRDAKWTADLVGYRSDEGSLSVVAVNGDGAMTLWREHTGECQLADMSAHPLDHAAFALALASDPEGRRLLVGAGATLRVWNTENHDLLHEHPLGKAIRVLTATTVPGWVASGHNDGSITVWDMASGAQFSFAGGGEPVTALAALHSDGLELLAAGSGNTIDLWNLGSQQRAGRLTGHSDTVTALRTMPASSFNDVRLASTARDRSVRIWDVHSIRRALEPADTVLAVVDASSTTDSATAAQRVAVSYTTGRVKVWDTSTGTSAEVLISDSRNAVTALAWAPPAQGRRVLLWAAADHSIRCWDPWDGQAGTALHGHSLPVRALASCAAFNERRIAISGGDDHTVRLWDLDRSLPLQMWRHAHSVRAVAAASDGHSGDWFASGSADGTTRLWNSHDGPGERILSCHQGVINAIAINPLPGSLPAFLVTGGDDGTVRLWDMSTTAPMSKPLTGHTDAVETLATWSTTAGTSRSYVASAARDGTIRLWDAATARCVLQLATGSRVRALSAHVTDQSAGRVILTMAGEAGVAVLELDLDDLPFG